MCPTKDIPLLDHYACITPLVTIVQSQTVSEPPWSHTLHLFSLAASMTVNTLVTGLIVSVGGALASCEGGCMTCYYYMYVNV